jgi:sigma-54 dependent transcriptional regulator, acetoin dehydrogenase operon transcriptional activator AcoR
VRIQLQRPDSASLSNDLPRDKIRDSWQRCVSAGLDPTQVPKQTNASSQELRKLIDQESLLVHVARPELCKLQTYLPGDNCLIGFANRDAILIDVVCSNPMVRSASRSMPGSCWREMFRGTNAIGTAAFSGSPTAVSLQEHFLHYYAALTCLAAPVIDPDGEIAGIIHVSSNSPIRQQHTMSLLCMSALHIESELFKRRHRSAIMLQFHSREEFADTLDAGLIAFDEGGRILGSNRQARFFLEELPLENGRHFDEIFRAPFREVIGRRQMASDVTRLVDTKGGSSAVRVHVPESSAKCWPVPRRTPKVQELGRPSAPPFICTDPAISDAVSLVARAVAMSVPILIRGETGTGKEMLAQHAHQLSGRSGRFVAINCAAVPESLIESELFGYREGAFTGARSGGAEGLVLQADGGTLFLDEIGDMALNLQPALLRFLDSWTIRPIGSSREVKVNIQLITATNCDLEKAIAEKRFRSDLLHRIEGVEILLPPLRDRSDFDEIVRNLLNQISPHLEIGEDALSFLREQPWAGNMRELRNLLVRSMLTCDGGHLSAAAVEPFLRKGQQPSTGSRRGAPTLRDVRRRAALDAYRKNDGNISKAAQSLHVSRNTLYRELREAGLINSGTQGPLSRRAALSN